MSVAFDTAESYVPPIPEHHIIRRPITRDAQGNETRKKTKPAGLKAKSKKRDKLRHGMRRH